MACGNLASEDTGTTTTTELRYPCYVLPVVDFLKLDKFESHAKLLKMGLLRRWTSRMRKKIIFVSHQWLGYQAVDPDNDHFQALHRMLSRLIAGQVGRVDDHWSQCLSLDSNSSSSRPRFGDAMRITWSPEKVFRAEAWKSMLPQMCIWMDYLSMPQLTPSSTDLQRAQLMHAVQSVPAYVELCSLILVLTPVSRHHDTGATCNYASWFERGWCRLEIWFARLCRHKIDIMVCTGGESTPFFLAPSTFKTGSWDTGKFSCCELHHQVAGKRIPCDKVRMRSILNRMIEAKVKYAKNEGHWMDMLYYSAIRLTPMVGQLETEPLEDSAVEFRKFVNWDHCDKEEAQKAGWSLLLLAAMCGQNGAVCEILASSPQDIHQSVAGKVGGFPGFVPGLTPMMAAMAFGNWNTVERLLEARANPLQVTASGSDALMQACSMGNVDTVVHWLARFPDWDLERQERCAGFTALGFAVATGSTKAPLVKALLSLRANVHHVNSGGGNYLCSLAHKEAQDLATLALLLEAGCNVNHVMLPCRHTVKVFFKGMHFLGRITGSRLFEEYAMIYGSTPLHLAAKRGDAVLVKALLEAAACVQKNHQARTPLDVALAFFGEVPAALKAAFAEHGHPCKVPQDCY